MVSYLNIDSENMQTTSKLLMVRPAQFGFNKETAQNNYFQQNVVDGTVAEKAVKEFDAFVQLLKRNDVDVTVVQNKPDPPTTTINMFHYTHRVINMEASQWKR